MFSYFPVQDKVFNIMGLIKDNNNNNSLKAELSFSSDYNFKNMLPWTKSHILFVLSQFRGTFGKEDGKIQKIKNLS